MPLPSALKKEVPKIHIKRENIFVPSLKVIFKAKSSQVLFLLRAIPSLSRRESSEREIVMLDGERRKN